jgi:alkylation response protein AidB-like acyl-CoA dehydrogenase
MSLYDTQEERHHNIREMTREFVQREISRELARETDRTDMYPHTLIHKLCEIGLMGVNVPEAYGGMGGNVIDVMLMYEEISKRLPVLSWAAGNITLYGNEILLVNGTKKQQEAYLPRLLKGEMLFCFALTEPDAGSDAANIKTRAVLEDGCYSITGNKMFISGAGVSDIAVTMTRTGESRYKGITTFLVDSKSDGYTAKPIKKLGYNGSNTCEVYYENVKVAPDHILGGEKGLNNGWTQMMNTLNGERLALSACALGIGQAAVDDTLQFAKEHFRFDTIRYQSIQHTIVEMATELEAARQLAYYAARKEVNGDDCIRETSMSKYFTTETAKKVVSMGMSLLGEYGSLEEVDMQRYLRDVLILSVGGGTTQIQKNIVSKTLGL